MFVNIYSILVKCKWLYLKEGSFLILASRADKSLDKYFVTICPFLHKSIVGWTNSDQGSLPYLWYNSQYPFNSPGTAIDLPPKKWKSIKIIFFNFFQAKTSFMIDYLNCSFVFIIVTIITAYVQLDNLQSFFILSITKHF